MESNFKKLNSKESAKIYGGSVLATVLTVLPAAISALTSFIPMIRAINSSTGEVNKSGAKWNDKSDNALSYRPVYVAY